jgi:hypothetical protein
MAMSAPHSATALLYGFEGYAWNCLFMAFLPLRQVGERLFEELKSRDRPEES